MSNYYPLKSLEGLLETFLDKVVRLKSERLQVLEGVNRLDDIARMSGDGSDVTDEIGEWFASHNQWLQESVLKASDAGRIGRILGEIKQGLTVSSGDSAARKKIESEIDRWSQMAGKSEGRLTLKRDPELVLADVKRNLATVKGARDYGVVIKRGQVDAAATKKLRAEMRKKRGKVTEVFNFGPSLETIVKKAKRETGLEAPVRPVFR